MNESLIIDALKNLKEGNLQSFNIIYEETKKIVFYNIVSIIYDYDLAEDLLQETYINFLNSLRNINLSHNPIGYLLKISKNLSLNELKKQKKQVSLDEITENTIVHEKEIYDGKSILLEKFSKILNSKERQIVILHVLNDLTFEEIAKLLSRPLGTILWSYNNSIKKLRKGLKIYEKIS